MKRRSFLNCSGQIALMSGFMNVPTSKAIALDCNVRRLPGVQLFSFREGLQQDPTRVLAQLHASGVREIELYGLEGQNNIFGMPAGEFVSFLRHQGLAMNFSHISGDDIPVAQVSAQARALDIHTLVLAIAPGFMQPGPNGLALAGPQNMADLDALVELLDDYGRQFAGQGLRFAYHNHHIELQPVDGEIPLDYVIKNTDPELVHFELDLGWIALSGSDPVDYLNSYGDRIVSCHLKDYTGNAINTPLDFFATASELVEPGKGIVDYAAVLDALDANRVEHGFIEVDISADPLQAINNGLEFLAATRQC